MNRFTADDDDDWDDDEYDSEDDDSAPCPYCGREIHTDAVRCPFCENYISAEDQPQAPKPLWIKIGLILCLAIALLWLTLGF